MNSKRLLKWIASTAVFALVCIGIQWRVIFPFAWYDDVIINNTLHSYLTQDSNGDLVVRFYVLISDAVMALKSIFPSLNFLVLTNALAISLIVVLAVRLIGVIFRPAGLAISRWLAVLVVFVFLLNQVVIGTTFTVLSLLLVALGILNFMNDDKSSAYLYLLPTVFGVLIRTDVLFLLIPLLALMWFAKRTRKYQIAAILIALLVLPLGLEWFNYSPEVKELQKHTPFIHNILDAGNAHTMEEMMAVDSARTMAFFSWYQGDYDNLLNSAYKQALASHSPFSYLTLRKASFKLSNALTNACCRYPAEYTPYRNWLKRGLLLWLLILGFSIYFSYQSDQRKEKVINLFVPIIFTGLILVTTVLYKMEYRIFFPLAFTSLLVLFLLNRVRLNWRTTRILFLGLLISLPFVLSAAYKYQRDLSEETALKEKFLVELDEKFEDKLVFFDLFSASLFTPHLYGNQMLGRQNNTTTVYGEVFKNFDSRHIKYLETFCGSTKIVPFFSCLYERRDEVIFAFTDFRVAMYELYFRDLYGIDVRFKKLMQEDNALKNIDYSYSWNQLHMDYYVLDSFEKIEY